MGRYDGPHFEVDDENVVSVWASTVAWGEIPEDYWEYNLRGGDDDPWNRFSSDFGFGYYDDDFVESYFDDPEKKTVPIGDLIRPLSYSTSFLEAVTQRAKSIGHPNTSYVFLMYNFKYDPRVTGKERSSYFRFVGTFAYDDEADPTA